MEIILEPRKIQGLPEKEQEQLRELLEVYNRHRTKNKIKNDYYEGDIKLEKVNLGIALPKNLQKLEIGCSWGEKTVDVLANRSMFDGFVGVDGNSIEQLDRLVLDNQLLTEYPKTCRDELKIGCTFATLSKVSPPKPFSLYISCHAKSVKTFPISKITVFIISYIPKRIYVANLPINSLTLALSEAKISSGVPFA